jgi:hypothetical protein
MRKALIQQDLRHGESHGIVPRDYTSDPYGKTDLMPLGDFASKLVDPADYKEVIDYAHREKIMPIYHLHKWFGQGKVFDRWDQNGLGYCWTWGLTAGLQCVRACEGKTPVALAPNSLGHLVGWRNRGNYLLSALSGMRETGVCELSYVDSIHSINPRRFKRGWEENALQYRLSPRDLYDTDPRRMIQHAVTLLARLGLPGYDAYDWWGHALLLVSLEWDERQPNNITWINFNSHDDGIIKMTGQRAVPSELYGLGATITDSR